jgi:putative oxidoreductase
MSHDRQIAYGAFLVRASLGAMYLTHGLWKASLGLYNVESFLQSEGLPALLAPFLIVGEIVGGLAIMMGWLSRPLVAAFLPVLFGAVLIHARNGFIFSNPNGGYEYPLFLIIVSVAHLLLGDGAFAWSRRTAAYPQRGAAHAA